MIQINHKHCSKDEEYIKIQSERLLDLELSLQQYKSILNDMMTEYPEIILKYNERLIKAEENLINKNLRTTF